MSLIIELWAGKPQTWVRDDPIGHRNVNFFAPGSVIWKGANQIGHRHEKLAAGRAVAGAYLRPMERSA